MNNKFNLMYDRDDEKLLFGGCLFPTEKIKTIEKAQDNVVHKRSAFVGEGLPPEEIKEYIEVLNGKESDDCDSVSYYQSGDMMAGYGSCYGSCTENVINGMLVIYINVGQLPSDKAEIFIDKITNSMKETLNKLSRTGIEHMVLPIREGSTCVEYIKF